MSPRGTYGAGGLHQQNAMTPMSSYGTARYPTVHHVEPDSLSRRPTGMLSRHTTGEVWCLRVGGRTWLYVVVHAWVCNQQHTSVEIRMHIG